MVKQYNKIRNIIRVLEYQNLILEYQNLILRAMNLMCSELVSSHPITVNKMM